MRKSFQTSTISPKLHNQVTTQRHYLIEYSRTPLIRPPSESHWCGRIRGMVAREGFVYEQKALSVTRNVVVLEGWSLVRVVVRQGFYCSVSTFTRYPWFVILFDEHVQNLDFSETSLIIFDNANSRRRQ